MRAETLSTDQGAKRTDSPFTRRQLLGSAGTVLLLLGQRPAAASDSIVMESEGRHFRIMITGLRRTEPINRLHGFDLVLSTSDGRAAAGAVITLTGERLLTPNPLPTLPQVKPGVVPGSYRVEGLRFHIGGEWRLVFAIELEQIHDRASLNLQAE